jgi:uncharacterized protein (TIGR01319 family)
MSSIIDAEILLAVDIGSVNTRANLFDVVNGRYRIVATGHAPSTGDSPLFDVSEGVRMCLDKLQSVTGRKLIDENEALIMPVTTDGFGVDIFVATTTAGPKVRTVLAGLMPEVSLESIRRLASSSYLKIVAEIGLMDRRQEEEQIDVILSTQPDLILISGGTDGGASDSVMKLVETVGIASHLLPRSKQPRIIFAGNNHLDTAVVERIGESLPLMLASNVRPSLEVEDLDSARGPLAEAIADVRTGRVSGFEELILWSGGHIMLTASAFGRVVRYLSQIYNPDKGVLGVDLGASQTTIAVAFDGNLNVSVQAELGMGTSLSELLEYSSIEDIKRWLPVEIADSRIQDYIHNKSIFPRTIPVELEEMHLEYGLAREVIRSAMDSARQGWSREYKSGRLMPTFDPIFVGGGVFSGAPRPGFVALTLLDALQPTGISTLILDPHNVIPSLGVAAGPLPIATVQVLEAGGFVNLGTAVSPMGRARKGRRVLRLRLEYEDDKGEMAGEVRMGQLVVLPLAPGENARLTLRPERGIDVGFGSPGKAGMIRVTGGGVGLIIDARGRPIALPKSPEERQEMNQQWLWDIGAME